MQQHLIATNYPGLLDGLTTSQVFPDHMDQVMGSLDCRPLMHYFWPTRPPQRKRAGDRQPAVRDRVRRGSPSGAASRRTATTCAVRRCSSSVPTAPSSSPARNVACGLAGRRPLVANQPGRRAVRDLRLHAPIFGVSRAPDATKGRGRSASDNVGVQYGLKALQAGQITPAQFVDLNSKVGGIDIDGKFTPGRKSADPLPSRSCTTPAAVNDGSGMANLPEIDDRTGAPMDDTGFHPAMESFAYRARLDKTNGQHDTPGPPSRTPGRRSRPSST